MRGKSSDQKTHICVTTPKHHSKTWSSSLQPHQTLKFCQNKGQTSTNSKHQSPTLQAAPESKGLRGDKPQTAELMTFSKPPHNSFRSLQTSSLLSWEGPELNTEHSEEAEPSSMDLALWTDSGEGWEALGCAGSQVQSLRGPSWPQNL